MNNIFGQFIVFCWAIFLIYWIIAAFSVKRTVEGKGWRSRGWRLPIVIALVVFFFFRRSLFSKYAGNVLWQRTLTTEVIADFLTLAGLIVLIWARRTLGGNWSSDVVIKKNHELIERGPYAYVRHPIYSGFLLMTLGVVVFSGHAGAPVIFAIVFFGFWFKSRQEERLLGRYFPEAYPKYKKRVKAFIPFIF